jgi:transcription antitermination factor NusG
MPALWHVIVTRSSAELSTAARLALAGFRTVAPVAQVWRRPAPRHLRKDLTDRALLVGYVFAAAPIADWRAVLAVLGVRGVLTVDGAAAVVHTHEIERLMRAGGRAPIEAGDKVDVAAGIFAGQRLEVLAMDASRREVVAAVEMLGSRRPVAISVDLLAA